MTNEVQETVREKYAAIAASSLSSEQAGVLAVAEAFGYTREELESIPAAANMGLSCGNPTATANIRAGETVLDLGSGGGLDVLLAAQKTGPDGKAIGVDMTAEMVERARGNAAKQGLLNVEFHHSTIDDLPLADGTVDCVISNCVINLTPDKSAVFKEIHRVLKPGGRVAISDIALKKELPAELAGNLDAYVGCVAGAIPIGDYVAGLNAAGFKAVQVVDTKKDLNAYSQVEGQSGCCAPAAPTPARAESACCTPAPAGSTACCTPKEDAKPMAAGCCTPAPVNSTACCTLNSPEKKSVHGGLAELLRKYDVNEFAASVQVYGVKA